MGLDIEEHASKEERLFNHGLGVRVALHLVGVEKRLIREPFTHQINLLNQIGSIAYAHVEPLALEGRGLMGGISDCEHIIYTPVLRYQRIEFVDGRSDDFHIVWVQIWIDQPMDRVRRLYLCVIVASLQGEFESESVFVGPMILPFTNQEGRRPLSLRIDYLVSSGIEIHTRTQCRPRRLYINNKEVYRLPKRLQFRTHLLSDEAPPSIGPE